jgi:hypothetical protein
MKNIRTRVLWCDYCRRRRRFVRHAPDLWGCPCGRSGEARLVGPRRYLVTVDEEDIEKGVRGSPRSCAMAKAVRRAGIRKVAVTGETLILGCGRGLASVHLELLQEMKDWTADWDARKPVSPFRFRIELGDYKGIILEGALCKGKAT